MRVKRLQPWCLSYRKTTGYAFVYVILEELTYMLLSLQVKNSFKKLLIKKK